MLNSYRHNWQRVGALVAMGIGGGVVLASRRMSKLRMMAALNFAALLVHQYEEYQDPGYFPGHFNGGMLKSDTPTHYPLNANSSLVVNTFLAYPVYICAIIFPNKKLFGVPPVFLGIAQAIGHGLVFPRIAKVRYSPGFLAAFFLHVPIGISYLRELKAQEGMSPGDWAVGVLNTAIMCAAAIGAPIELMKDKNSAYKFTQHQLGRYALNSDRKPRQVIEAQAPIVFHS